MNKFVLALFFALSLTVAFAQDHTIEVSNNIFTPASLTITQGETVQWTNVEGFHNVNGDQGTYAANPESFSNGAASMEPWTFRHTFSVPGTYTYQCDPHVNVGMVGTIIVEAGVISGDLVLSGVFDAQPSGAGAKGFELFAVNAIADLSAFGIGSANNGDGSDGEEVSFPSMALAAGECIYVAADSTMFNDFFGFFPHFTGGAANINGDDAIEVFEFGVVIDVFGDINVDGNGEPWEYLDGWAYRKDGTPANMGTFNPSNWTYSGVDALQDIPNNAGAASPFPSCTYSSAAPTMIETADDTDFVDQDGVIVIDVTANDILPNGIESLTIATAPTNGSAMVTLDDVIIYTPNAGFCGADQFTYQVCDNVSCETAVVDVTVICPTTYTTSTIGNAGVIDANGVLTTIGNGVELTGIVHGIDFQGNNPVQFTIIDQSGGIGLFSDESFGYTVVEGDEVTVQGVMSQFNGLAQINPDTIILNSTGNPLNTPTDVTTLSEATESQLVRFSTPVTIDAADWLGDGSSFNITASNGETIRIDSDTELANMASLQSYTFFVTGIGGQFDNSSPFTEGYQLFPRYLADISFDLTNANKEAAWANEIAIFPNPATDVINVKTDLQFDEIRVINVIGEDMILLKNTAEINIKALQAGAYFVTFKKDDEFATKRFVKL